MESDFRGLLTSSPVVLAIVVGASALILVYILLFRRKVAVEAKPKRKALYSKDDKGTVHSEKKKEAAPIGKNKKKVLDNRWSGRSEKQSYNHPCLLTSLKGHTAPIFDVDFSSNGKYLISCGDEDPDPGGLTADSSSSSEYNKENNHSLSADASPCTKGLSRRQRKNRKREDVLAVENPKQRKQKGKKSSYRKKRTMATLPLKQYWKLNKPDGVLTELLHFYVVSLENLKHMGYPLPNADNRVVIYKPQYKPARGVPAESKPRGGFKQGQIKCSTLDATASTFVPFASKNDSNDSGQGSASSSDSGENFDGEDSSSSCSSDLDTSYYKKNPLFQPEAGLFERTCSRCTKTFYTTSSSYISKDKCCYHWGRLHSNTFTLGDGREVQLIAYSCCQHRSGSRGCTESDAHVWSGVEDGVNGYYDDYVFTRPRKTPPPDGNYGVYALDCEMCYTVQGLELTEVTVVGLDGRMVYTSYVRPDNEIVDYNTRFSGITSKHLQGSAVKSLREVQNDLMGFINSRTILIGHGLENDLRALKLVHYNVIDTCYWFPHQNGFPFRRSLKYLAAYFLRRQIQTHGNGHDSYEDASACMELMLWLVRKDYKEYLVNVR